MLKFVEKIFGTKSDKDLKAMRPLVDKINSFEPQMKKLSDDELKAQTVKFRQMLANGTELMTGGRFEIALLDGVQVNGRQFAEIRMQDTGPGMPEAAVRALSFPDEVTGDRERGLGLSIVGRLAAGMGATVSCRSRAGTGTTLSLLVPATP